MPIDHLSIQEAEDLLRHCLEEGQVVLGKHFREELANEAITIQDARSVMKSGRIYNAPEFDVRHREWNYRIEGHEPGGKWICVVFSFKEEDTTFLITIFSVQSRSK